MCKNCKNIQWPALKSRRVIIGTSGSISIYRIPDLIRDLKRHGADVTVGMSGSSEALVGKDVFKWASDNDPVLNISGDIEHIKLFGDGLNTALLLAPASYNLIGKIASGIADTVPSLFFAQAFGLNIPVIVAPAMHRGMLENSILAENMQKLRDLGILFVEPELDPEKARLSSQNNMLDHVYRAFYGNILNGKKILIISGRTEESIDPVRTVTNRSTGTTGYWLSRNAFRMGAEKIVFAGNTSEEVPPYVDSHLIYETDKLYREVETLLSEDTYDLILVPAAVSDFYTEKRKKKIKSSKKVELSLNPREKLLDRIRKKHTGFLAAFRLNENDAGIREHFKSSSPDFIVFNQIAEESAPFGESTASYRVFTGKSDYEINEGKKDEATFRLLAHISNSMEGKS